MHAFFLFCIFLSLSLSLSLSLYLSIYLSIYLSPPQDVTHPMFCISDALFVLTFVFGFLTFELLHSGFLTVLSVFTSHFVDDPALFLERYGSCLLPAELAHFDPPSNGPPASYEVSFHLSALRCPKKRKTLCFLRNKEREREQRPLIVFACLLSPHGTPAWYEPLYDSCESSYSPVDLYVCTN